MKNIKNLVKKVLTVIMIGVISVTGLVGCGTTKEEKAPIKTVQPQAQEEKEEEIDVSIEDFEIKGEFKKDNSGATKYNATITNNSKYILELADYSYIYTNNDEEKSVTYISFANTLKPGETSPISKCLGDKDMKLQTISIYLVDKENNRDITLYYDAVLEETSVTVRPR